MHPMSTALALLTAITTTGCALTQQSSDVNLNRQATVAVMDPELDDPSDVTITVTSSRLEDGVGYLRSGQWDEAITSFEASLEKTSDLEIRGQAYYGIGLAHEAKGDLQSAERAYQGALHASNNIDYEDALSRVRTLQQAN